MGKLRTSGPEMFSASYCRRLQPDQQQQQQQQQEQEQLLPAPQAPLCSVAGQLLVHTGVKMTAHSTDANRAPFMYQALF